MEMASAQYKLSPKMEQDQRCGGGEAQHEHNNGESFQPKNVRIELVADFGDAAVGYGVVQSELPRAGYDGEQGQGYCGQVSEANDQYKSQGKRKP
jgi:hypothetical protein